MCLIVVALGAAPSYPFVVAANRDEQHARPTQAAAWWRNERILGGRDLLAGGTWLALDQRGRFAAVTNVRDPRRPSGPRSRGSLVTDFLTGSESAAQFATRAIASGAQFGPFNLLLYDGHELHLASNRGNAARLETGLHAFSNAPPGTDWPKTASARAGAAPLLSAPALEQSLLTLLAERYDADDDELLKQRTHFVVGPLYGTRSTTSILLDTQGRVAFVERSFDSQGAVVGEVRETFLLQR